MSNSLSYSRVLIALPLLILAATSAFAQSAAKTETPATVAVAAVSAPETRAAKVLFEEVNTYLDRKYAEFNKRGVPYSKPLETQVKQERTELGIKYAAVLQARKDLSAVDAYYLGMLNHLSGNSDAALEAMRRFLATTEATVENAQLARAVLVLYATAKNSILEAEQAVAAFAKNQPQNLLEWFGMETLITEASRKAKD